ncbi:hypothetical protein [Vreelandella utahensis]|uniref:hypothetical protein n=1 Tax=Vreelandella halophila TaxID=86177 RepID=UPI000984CB95|nr:hypothetical protein [Halomonas utahensis]
MSYSLIQVGPKVIEDLHNNWLDPLKDEENIPDTPYEMAVSWAEKSRNSHDNSTAYAVYGGEEPLALVDIRQVFPGQENGWLKVMNIVVAPRYDLRQPNTEALNKWTRGKEFGDIAAALVLESLELATTVKVPKVKIYASSEITLDFFELVISHMDEQLLERAQLDVDSHGNWLVFTIG